MHTPIAYDLKRRCVEANLAGKTAREVFNDVFCPEHAGMSWDTFQAKLRHWKRGAMADQQTEQAGTYPGMIAHAATVQVSGSGQVVQAWIKQHQGTNIEDLISYINENVKPVNLPKCEQDGETMLEVPIFDAHFGVATLEDYEAHLAEIVNVIRAKPYAEIHCIIGQDCIHTNDVRGHTAKGTDIGRIDFANAWRDAWAFWRTILDTAVEMSLRVFAHYSKGNHDETSCWCFFKALEACYQDSVIFDDSMAPRKSFTWEGVFVGYGHMEYAKAPDKIFRDFVLDFPAEFAAATCREIHTGHLHSESTDDGIVVRRLASAVPPDQWSRENGYIGVHKRFQLFEYSPGRLRSIVYV